jgi:hypothetical protein
MNNPDFFIRPEHQPLSGVIEPSKYKAEDLRKDWNHWVSMQKKGLRGLVFENALEKDIRWTDRGVGKSQGKGKGKGKVQYVEPSDDSSSSDEGEKKKDVGKSKSKGKGKARAPKGKGKVTYVEPSDDSSSADEEKDVDKSKSKGKAKARAKPEESSSSDEEEDKGAEGEASENKGEDDDEQGDVDGEMDAAGDVEMVEDNEIGRVPTPPPSTPRSAISQGDLPVAHEPSRPTHTGSPRPTSLPSPRPTAITSPQPNPGNNFAGSSALHPDSPAANNGNAKQMVKYLKGLSGEKPYVELLNTMLTAEGYSAVCN